MYTVLGNNQMMKVEASHKRTLADCLVTSLSYQLQQFDIIDEKTGEVLFTRHADGTMTASEEFWARA